MNSWSSTLRISSETSDACPERDDEYVFYQMLLGAWPPELSKEPFEEIALAAFRVRLEAAMIKSLRESKLRSTWAAPNEGYEKALSRFIQKALEPAEPNGFLPSFLSFQQRVAELGVRNSIIQTVLKLTAPGVPDIYQGSDLWDFSLVDPDNRRPVDYHKRVIAIAQSAADKTSASDDRAPRLMQDWQSGRVKMKVLSDLLAMRTRCPDLFASGSYEPIETSGGTADRICAFARCHGDQAIIVAANLCWHGRPTKMPNLNLRWMRPPKWKDLFTGNSFSFTDGKIGAEGLFEELPVAVLIQGEG